MKERVSGKGEGERKRKGKRVRESAEYHWCRALAGEQADLRLEEWVN